MKKIYLKIWKIAKEYYLKARPMDIEHIEWFMKKVSEVCKLENIDESILMPLAILHDVGYSKIPNPSETNYYKLDIRKEHMKKGVEIALEILNSVNYPKNKIKIITNYIAIHDNWAFGEVDIYIKDRLLGTFKDLDYLWIYTKKGCNAIQKILKKNNKEMLKHLKDEKSPIYGKKPFSTIYTREIHKIYLKERENTLNK